MASKKVSYQGQEVASRLLIIKTASLGRHSGWPTNTSPTRRGPRVPDRHVRSKVQRASWVTRRAM